MELRQLRHFLAICDNGSFRKAAESLNISQPALSASLRGLEAIAGGSLLDRGPRGARPTPLGLALQPYALAIMRDADRARRHVRSLSGSEESQVFVGTLSALTASNLSEIIGSFLGVSPDVRIDVQVQSDENLLRLIREARIDFAYAILPPKDHRPKELVFEELRRSKSQVYARKGHPLTKLKKVSLCDLSDFRWILNSRLYGERGLFAPFDNADSERPAVGMRCDSFPMIKEMLIEQPLLALMPDETATDFVAKDRLQSIDQSHLKFSVDLGLIYDPERIQTSAATKLMQHFRRLL